MAHFAKLDDINIVMEVIVVNNAVIDDLPFPESEPVGIEFLTEWSGGYTHWLQTSYNGSFRVNYAGTDYLYNPILDAFIAPQPFSSWTLNETTCQWEAPVPYPTDGPAYYWEETTLNWVAIPKLN
jgi:hypothetical protein